MQLLKLLNQFIAFSLEIGMFIAIGFWGARQGKAPLARYSLAILLPLAAIILWGIYAAPNSKYRLEFNYRIVFEMAMFSCAAVLLYKSGYTHLAAIFAVIVVISEIIAFIFKQ